MTGAELLIKLLAERGVDSIFGYPGGAIMPIYDALYQSPVKHYLCRHEQGGAFSALSAMPAPAGKSWRVHGDLRPRRDQFNHLALADALAGLGANCGDHRSSLASGGRHRCIPRSGRIGLKPDLSPNTVFMYAMSTTSPPRCDEAFRVSAKRSSWPGAGGYPKRCAVGTD